MITLEQAKFQCRIEQDNDYEDSLLLGYIAAARDHVQMHLDRNIYPIPDDDSIYPPELPVDDPEGIFENASIDQAMLLLVAHWYEHREGATGTPRIMTEIPLGVRHLLQPYRRMGV